MHLRAVLIAVGLLGVPVLPAVAAAPLQPAPALDRQATRDAIRAATQQGIDDLYAQIAVLPLNSRATVGQFVKELSAEDELMKILARADQIGSPRWLDGRTCQVQLEISASRVAYVLKQLAAARPNVAPARVYEIDRAVERWPRRTFVTTGSSAMLPSTSEFRPLGVQWAGVSAKARRKALHEAGVAARERAIQSVSSITLNGTTTVGTAMASPAVRQTIDAWLGDRPVTRVDFRDDLTVEVALAVDDQEFFNVFKSALQGQRSIAVPRDERDWQRVQKEFGSRFAQPVGSAKASADVAADGAWHAPAAVPEWAEQTVEVRGTGIGTSKLKAALAAEADARTKLRARVESLVLEGQTTLGDVARSQRAAARAIDRAVERASITRTEYNPDNSASVQLWLDLRSLWDDLRR